MEIEWKRRAAIAGIILGVIAGYRWLTAVLLPFLAAWMLAGWLYPAAVKIEKHTGIKKTFAGGTLLLLFFLAAGALMYLGLGELFRQVRTACAQLPSLWKTGRIFLNGCCALAEKTTGIAAADMKNYLFSQTEALGRQAAAVIGPGAFRTASSVLRGSFLFFSGLIVMFISALLLLGDMERVRKTVRDYSWLVGARHVVRRLRKTTITYLKAQAVIMVLVGTLCALGFWLLKNPYFLILGIGVGILDALPLIGTGTFLYPAALFFFIQGKYFSAAGCVLLDIAASLLREFLEPRLLGEKLGVSPVLILMSVYLGIFLYGIWGVILGPLTFSTIYEIGREWDVWG